MKTLNANSINAQKSNNPFIIENIWLYELFSNNRVKSVDAANTATFYGDLTSELSADDEVCFPLVDFTQDTSISTITYNIGTDDTEIVLIDGILDTIEHLGTFIAKKYDITDKLLKNSIKDVVQKIEGVELNNFDSGKLDFDVDNADGYFSNKQKTGIIDSEGIFFVKYLLKFKASQDTDLIYFGGILSLTDSQPDYYNKSYGMRVLGHSKELERYAAYKVSNYGENTFTKISGVIVIDYESSDDSQEGIKTVKYEPFSNSKMKGVTVESVSQDTPEGIKILEFRWPYFFRWDNGAWYQIGSVADTSSGKKKMYGKDGSVNSRYAIVVFGDDDTLNEYPDEDTEDWVDVKNTDTLEVGKEVSQQGAPKFSFDNGEPIYMKIHFQRVLKYDDSGGTYTEISDVVNIPLQDGSDPVDVMEAASDEIIIIAPERFWGIEFNLYDMFSAGSLEVRYSQGGTIWSDPIDLGNNGFVDGTAGFTQSGKMRWTDLPNWSENDIVVSTSVDYKGFMIRIVMTSQTGTLSFLELKRIIKAQGETGDFLTIQFIQTSLSKEQITDDIVISKDVGENWRWSFWYNNVPVGYLLDICLDESSYIDSKRSLTSLKIIKTSPRFNIWGKSPKFSYSKIMKCFHIEYADEDNFTVWALIENEIWKCTNQGIWEFVYEIIMPSETITSTSHLFGYVAQQIIKVGDSLFCYFSYYHLDSYMHGGRIYFVEYDIITGILTVIAESAFGSATKDCFQYNRDGYGFHDGTYYKRRLGNYLGTHYGENACIPFRQWLNARGSMIPAQYPMQNLWDNFTDAFPEWYYDQYDVKIADNAGLYYKGKMGFYGLFNAYDQSIFQTEMEFKFTFGQKGMLLMLKSTGETYLFVRYGSSPNYYWILTKLNDDTPTRHVCYDANQLPSAHWYDEVNDELFLCYTAWRDDALGEVNSNSYITKTLLAETPVGVWARVYHYDSGTFVTTEITTQANAGTLFASGYVFAVAGDIVYCGSDKRFNKVYFAMTTPTSTYVIEYWDGGAWTAVQANYDDNFTDPFMAVFNCPSDWAQTVVSGSQNLYYVRFRMTAGAGTTMVAIELTEVVLWHSHDDGHETWSPINIIGHKDYNGYLYGVAFNRTPEGDNPFQWRLFSLDKEGAQIGTPLHFCTDVNPIDFTIDNTQLYKDLVFNPIDNHVYLIAENIRFKDRSAYLLKMQINEGTEQLDVTFCGIPVTGEWGNSGNNHLVCEENSGNIYGITDGTKFKFWEYAKEYYQRIEVADLTSFNSIRDVIRELALITNCIYFVTSERIVKFIKRDEYNGTIDLTWDENVLTEKPEFTRWEHYFDAVIVDFKSVIDDDTKGDKKLGYDSWLKKVMRIQSALIQNEHIALVVCEDLYNFYNNYRINVKSLKTIPLTQLELTDKFNLFMPDDIIDIDSTTDFIIISVSKKSDFNIILEGLERIITEIGAS